MRGRPRIPAVHVRAGPGFRRPWRRRAARRAAQCQSMYVDSHCHLSFPELRTRLDAILADMRAAEVAGALCICTAMEEFELVRDLAAAHSNLWASIGVHPDTEGMTEPTLESLCEG